MTNFTVVTSTLDAAEYLPQCLDSVKAQEESVRHLVVDGGSTDSTVEIAEARGCDVIRAPGTSLYEALNVGFQAARSPLLSYLNADDVLLPGALKRVYRWFGERPAIHWGYGSMEYVNADGTCLGRLVPPKQIEPAVLTRLGWLMVPQPAMFLRTDVAQQYRFDESLRLAADYDYVMQLLADGRPHGRIPHTLAQFRLHSSNLTWRPEVAREAETVVGRWEARYPGSTWLAARARVTMHVRSPRLTITKLRGRFPLR